MLKKTEFWLKDYVVVKSLNLLSKRDKTKIALASSLQFLLSLLDLLGVAIFGILSALAISGIESNKPGIKVSYVLNLLHLSSLTFKNQIAILGVSAGLILVIRSISSMWITWRVLLFLGKKSAEVSTKLLEKFLNQSLLQIKARPTQEVIYLVTNGVDLVTLRVLGSAISIFSDLGLLIVLILGLFYLDATVAVSTIVTFSTLIYLLYFFTSKKVELLGAESSRLTIKSNQVVMESIETYRESVVRNTLQFFITKFSELREQLARRSTKVTFIPNIGKYVLEGVVVLGSLLLAGFQFFTKDAVHAIATLTIFMAAGSRIAPAALRIQQNFLQIVGNTGSALDTLKLYEELSTPFNSVKEMCSLDFDHVDFIPNVILSDLNFSYEKTGEKIIKDINLNISPGSLIAIVGPSGAGKTTLVDLLLGLLTPDSGKISISGVTPRVATTKWPGAIGYVPQDVAICEGSLAENIYIGYQKDESTLSKVWEASSKAKLLQFVLSLPKQFETEVGERGTSLSGGQKQRLGIARALYTSPKLLVLDEATSALDGETEKAISDSLKELRIYTTQIVIAHRLSTVREADQVIYMNEGRILAQGTFEEVRRAIPNFDNQAKLMGL